MLNCDYQNFKSALTSELRNYEGKHKGEETLRSRSPILKAPKRASTLRQTEWGKRAEGRKKQRGGRRKKERRPMTHLVELYWNFKRSEKIEKGVRR